MADRPISDLPIATSVSDNDFLIVNKNNTETKRISIENFGGLSGYSPMYLQGVEYDRNNGSTIPVGSTYVGPGGRTETAVAGAYVTPAVSMFNDPNYTMGVGQNRVTINLPAGADAAIVHYRCQVRTWNAHKPTKSTAVSYGRGRVQDRISTQPAGNGDTINEGRPGTNILEGYSASWRGNTAIGEVYNMGTLSKFFSVHKGNPTAGINTITLAVVHSVQDSMFFAYHIHQTDFVVYPYDSSKD